jgi:chromosome segregation ATPase
MKYPLVLVVVLLIMVLGNSSSARGQGGAPERASSLRSQLSELETKQSALETRLQALDENLKPENIEQSLAGVGSTRPEELREQKRRQLEIERNGVQTQLNLLAASRTRLEASIARADAEAYQQSAAPQRVTPQSVSAGNSPASTNIDAAIAPAPRRVRKKRTRRARRAHHLQGNLGTRVAQVEDARSNRGGSAVSVARFAVRGS